MKFFILFTLIVVAQATTITNLQLSDTEYKAGDDVLISWAFTDEPSEYYSLTVSINFDSGSILSFNAISQELKLTDSPVALASSKNTLSSDQYFVQLNFLKPGADFQEIQINSTTFTIKQGGQAVGDPGNTVDGDRPSTSSGNRLRPFNFF